MITSNLTKLLYLRVKQWFFASQIVLELETSVDQII